MALMFGSLYEALIAGNVPPDKAQRAAEEAAAYLNRIAGVENRLARVEADVQVVKCIAGTNVALTLAVLVRSLFL